MIDKISLDRLQKLHPAIREEAIRLYREEVVPALTGDYFCRIVHTYRSFEEQAELYAKGRTKLFDKNGKRLGIVTKAKPGLSWHQYCLAIDYCLINKNNNGLSWDIVKDYDKDGKSDWLEVAEIFKKHGWVWGGDWKSFKDYPHLEFPIKYNIREMLKKYNQGDVFQDNNLKYVNI